MVGISDGFEGFRWYIGKVLGGLSVAAGGLGVGWGCRNVLGSFFICFSFVYILFFRYFIFRVVVVRSFRGVCF